MRNSVIYEKETKYLMQVVMGTVGKIRNGQVGWDFISRTRYLLLCKVLIIIGTGYSVHVVHNGYEWMEGMSNSYAPYACTYRFGKEHWNTIRLLLLR
jgi:hypothetical protein